MSAGKLRRAKAQTFQSLKAATTSARWGVWAEGTKASRCSPAVRSTSNWRSDGERYQAVSGESARKNQPNMPRHTDGIPSIISNLIEVG